MSASGQGGLLVRVAPEQVETLLAEPAAEEFRMRGRAPMKGWLRVGSEVLADDAVLARWVERGVDYALTLPPKKT